MNELQIFDSDPEHSLFELRAEVNDVTYWWAREMMTFLGYENWSAFRSSSIKKAQMACLQLNIPVDENFIAAQNSKGQKDLKLTRFACYLIAMNSNPKYPQVAKAQAYFVAMAESFRLYIEEAVNVERVYLRGEITEREKTLVSAAKAAKVQSYPLFQNAGYRGMYNMNLGQLKRFRGIPEKRSPLDYMGQTEMAANLFRITQTEQKIKTDSVEGQAQLEKAAEYVGTEVRKTMKKLSGAPPEDLPLADDITSVKKELKQTRRKFIKMDKKSIDKSDKKE